MGLERITIPCFNWLMSRLCRTNALETRILCSALMLMTQGDWSRYRLLTHWRPCCSEVESQKGAETGTVQCLLRNERTRDGRMLEHCLGDNSASCRRHIHNKRNIATAGKALGNKSSNHCRWSVSHLPFQTLSYTTYLRTAGNKTCSHRTNRNPETDI